MRAPAITLPGISGWRRSPGDRLEMLIVGIGVAAAAAVAGLVIAPDSILDPALIGIVALLCILPLVVRGAQGRWDPFEPIVLICASTFVLFVLRPLWMWMKDDWLINVYDAREGFTEAAVVVVVGTFALIAGYAVTTTARRAASRIPVIRDDWDPGRATVASLATLLMAAFLFTFHAGIEGFDEITSFFSGRSDSAADQGQNYAGERTTSGYFGLAPYMTIPVALVLLEVWRRRRSPAAGAIAVIAILAALAMTIPRGDRTWILALLMPLIVVPYLQRERRPRIISILVAVLISVFVANILIEYRNKSDRTESLGELTTRAVTGPGAQIDRFMLKADTAMFAALAAQVEATPERVPYFPGRQVTSLIFAPVPGLLWRDKPQAPGNYAYRELFRQTQTQAALKGVAVSVLGSYFADWGLIAVIVYSFASGFMLRVVFEYWRANRANASIGLVYAAMLPIVIITYRTSATLGLGATLVLIGPLIGIMWWANRGAPRPSAPPAGA